jgi:hypothetical protein
MHDQIIARGFYDSVERRPARQVSVEAACALEGLNEAYALARASIEEQDRANRYRRCICTALEYLIELQCTRDGTKRERGGFGLSLQDRTQRIDVTGHAASAFMKCVQNGIECGPVGG